MSQFVLFLLSFNFHSPKQSRNVRRMAAQSGLGWNGGQGRRDWPAANCTAGIITSSIIKQFNARTAAAATITQQTKKTLARFGGAEDWPAGKGASKRSLGTIDIGCSCMNFDTNRWRVKTGRAGTRKRVRQRERKRRRHFLYTNYTLLPTKNAPNRCTRWKP